MEIELKLQLTSQRDADLFKTQAFLKNLPHNQFELETTYFDTADLRLQKLNYALRIRKQGSQLIQTIKCGQQEDSALQRRQEWENDNARAEPQLELIAETVVQNKIKTLIGEKPLLPLFITRFHRDTWLYETESNEQIEIALDCGEILCQNKALPILEIELELKKGQQEEILHYLANLFSKTMTLKPGILSKAARGYQLALSN